MPDANPPPAPLPPAVEALVRQAAASPDRAAQNRALQKLVRASAAAQTPVFAALAAADPDGPRLALDFLARLPDPLPPDLVRAALPVLATRTVPVQVRLAAAAALLGSLPDAPRPVAAVVRALTAGLSRARAVERMYQLQARVERSAALDALVAESEARAKMRCPKCEARLTRPELVAHLWHRHRLVYEHGKASDPRPVLDAIVTTAAGTGDPDAVTRTFLLTEHYYPDAEPRHVLQALAARGLSAEGTTDRLLARAAAEGAGLCPVCLAAVPELVPPLPPPADVSAGRVAADGYAAAVEDRPAGRVLLTQFPGERPLVEPAPGPRRPARLVAVLTALPVLLLGLLVALVFPARWANPAWPALAFVVLGWLIYLIMRGLSRTPPDPTELAVDAAWSELAPAVGRSPPAVRFLTRLCRASIGIGDPGARAQTVFEIAHHAEALAHKGGAYSQFLAAARVLEAFDQARLGRDRTTVLLRVFEPFLYGDADPAYAEAAAEMVLTTDLLSAGEVNRLGLVLIETAFAVGLTPADLVTVARFAPWLRRLLLGAAPGHLALLSVVARGRTFKPWSQAGEATSVFQLAHDSPGAARKLLAEVPDVLLVVDLGGRGEGEVGRVLVTARGLEVGGQTAADPADRVEVHQVGRDWQLWFGPHKFALPDRISQQTVDALRGWLRYVTGSLFPTADRASRGNSGRAAATLGHLAVACPLCGTASVLRAGQVGTPWQAISG